MPTGANEYQTYTGPGNGILPDYMEDILDEVGSRDLLKVLGAVASICAAQDALEFYRNLVKFFRVALSGRVNLGDVHMFEFRRAMQPKHLYGEGCGFDCDMRRYLSGTYVLDPFFDMFENQQRLGVVSLNTKALEDLGATDYGKFYWRHLRASHEVGGLFELDAERCLHLSLLLYEADKTSGAKVANLLLAMEPFIGIMAKQFADEPDQNTDETGQRYSLHLEVSRMLRDFGKDVLTERERQLVQLLLRGHSAKSMARLLDISPGTISIHRSNIYRKMHVTSQGELYGMFLDTLVDNYS